MNQNLGRESTSSNNNYPIIFINPEGRVFIFKFDKEILEIMSTLNINDNQIKNLIKNENDSVVSFCG